MSTQSTLHYVYDPFCGWCYGAAPLLSAASEIDGLAIAAHGGGMLAGDATQMMSKEWREFVKPHEVRITQLSGQVFGSEYQEKTQYDYGVMLDSAPPTAAMLAAEEINGTGQKMLKRLQTAYYVEGTPIATKHELVRLAVEQGLDPNQFQSAFERSMANLETHFQQTRELLAHLGGRGYPTLALEHDGQFTVFPLGRYLGQPEKFRADLEAHLRVKQAH